MRALHRRGLPVRAMIPAQRRVPWLAELGVDLIEGEYDDGRRLEQALAGVQTAILIARPVAEQVIAQERVIDACVAAGVGRVAKFSVADAAPDAVAESARRHWRAEQHLHHAECEGLVVRSVRLMQDLLHQVPLLLSQRMLVGCQGDGAVADVDATDVGEVLAGLATSSDWPTSPVLVTGPTAMTREQMTRILSDAMGHALHYVPCTPLELTQTLMASGLPRWQVQDLVHFEMAARDGVHAQVTDAVAQWSGRRARPFVDFANELAQALRFAAGPTTTARTVEPLAPH